MPEPLLTDLTMLESLDGDCAADIGAMAELLNRHCGSTVIRVIPDPSKDIGFNIISLFHLRPPVKVHTRASLAEAISLLLQLDVRISDALEEPVIFARYSNDQRYGAVHRENGPW